MKIETIFVLITSIFCSLFITVRQVGSNENTKEKSSTDISTKKIIKVKSNSIRLYISIKKYSEEYGIPTRLMLLIAKKETGYKGIHHRNYKHDRTSPVGAVGPMQVMPSTAKGIDKNFKGVHALKNKIKYNVEISAKLLNLLKIKYNTWDKVLGAYNTGKPLINSYSRDIMREYDNDNKKRKRN